MNEQLSSLVLSVTVLVLTINEKKRLQNLFTPFTVAAWPFVIITLLVNFLVHYLGAPWVTVRANYFILLNLIVIWIVGYLLHYFRDIKIQKMNYETVFVGFYRYRYFFYILSGFIFAITYQRVISLVASHGGWWYIGTDEFGEEILHGIIAHAIMFAKVCFIVLFASFMQTKKNLIYYGTLLLFALTVFIAQNKYHLMMVFLMAFFLNSLQKSTKQQFMQVFKIAMFLVVVFCLYFFIVAIGWKTRTFASANIWDYFLKMFLNYLVSGPMNLDVWLNSPSCKPDWTLFMPWIDLWHFLTGNPNRIFQVPYLAMGFINTIKGFHSNVGTSYGVYYLIGGTGFTLFMTTLISVLSYIFYYQSMNTKNPVIIYLNVLFLSLGVLNFFVQYFTLMSLYEMTFSYILLISIFSFTNKYRILPKGIETM